MTVTETPAGVAPIDVAAEVRSVLARSRVRVNHLPGLIGKSQSYWSRRVNGEIAFDVPDLVLLAGALRVHPSRFFGVEGYPIRHPSERPPAVSGTSGWTYRPGFRFGNHEVSRRLRVAA